MGKQAIAVQEKRLWVGVDWGGKEHAVSVVEDNRAVLGQWKCGNRLEDLKGLASGLRALGSVQGIAIEAAEIPLVYSLSEEGFTVYPVNPKLSKNWRAGNSVAGVKSDVRDGLVLALELSRRHECLRPISRPDPAAAELAGLCQKHRDLIDQRTALVQALQAILKQYYPAARDFFADWASPAAWRFLKKFPRPEALARAKKDTLIAFLKANRIGLRPVWLKRIEEREKAAEWPSPPYSLALENVAVATAAQLLALQVHIQKFAGLIAQRAPDLAHYQLISSLPGAGKTLAPALTAMTAVISHDRMLYSTVRCLSGTAPVQDQSGKRNHTKQRRRCNKHWRNVLHLFAHCSTNACAWARAFYDLRREGGDTHATALRKLADKWLKIISAMLTANEPYDDARYVQELQRRRSPIYQRLCGKPCG